MPTLPPSVRFMALSHPCPTLFPRREPTHLLQPAVAAGLPLSQSPSIFPCRRSRCLPALLARLPLMQPLACGRRCCSAFNLQGAQTRRPHRLGACEEDGCREPEEGKGPDAAGCISLAARPLLGRRGLWKEVTAEKAGRRQWQWPRWASFLAFCVGPRVGKRDSRAVTLSLRKVGRGEHVQAAQSRAELRGVAVLRCCRQGRVIGRSSASLGNPNRRQQLPSGFQAEVFLTSPENARVCPPTPHPRQQR